MSYDNHSRIICCKKDKIQESINNGKLNAWDIIFTEDTHENILLLEDLSKFSVQSRIYRFASIESAEETLNKNTDTYEGQIVAILYKNSYVAYIVNKKPSGTFYVSPLSVYNGEVDYDTLGRRPVENVEGTIDSPVVLNRLKDGIYKIFGQYKITDADETTHLSMNSNFYLIHQNDDTGQTEIKKISASEICDYTVDENNQITKSIVPTTEWLSAQGYVTEGYVDAKIEALNLITKDEVSSYVESLVLQTLDKTLDDRINEKLNQQFHEATELEIVDMFNNK